MSRAGNDSTSARGTAKGGSASSTAGKAGPSGVRRWVKRGFLLLGAAFGAALALFAVAYARTDIPSATIRAAKNGVVSQISASGVAAGVPPAKG